MSKINYQALRERYSPAPVPNALFAAKKCQFSEYLEHRLFMPAPVMVMMEISKLVELLSTNIMKNHA